MKGTTQKQSLSTIYAVEGKKVVVKITIHNNLMYFIYLYVYNLEMTGLGFYNSLMPFVFCQTHPQPLPLKREGSVARNVTPPFLRVGAGGGFIDRQKKPHALSISFQLSSCKLK